MKRLPFVMWACEYVCLALLLFGCAGAAARAELLPALRDAWVGPNGISAEVEAGAATTPQAAAQIHEAAATATVALQSANQAQIATVPWEALRAVAVLGVDSWGRAGSISPGVRLILLERHEQFFPNMRLYLGRPAR